MELDLQKNTEYFEANGICDRPVPKFKSSGQKFEMGDGKFLFEKGTKLDEIDIKKLCDLWNKAGILDSFDILQQLELDKLDEGIVNFSDLFDTLEKEIKLSATSWSENSILNALLTSYKFYVHHVNTEMEFCCQELIEKESKLKKTTNQNAKLLEEIDNCYVNMDRQNEKNMNKIEKQWSNRLISTKRQFIEEREMMLQQFEYDKDALKVEIDSLHLSHVHSQRKSEVLEKENESLAQESFQLYKNIEDLENESQILRNDLEVFLMAKEEEEIKNVTPSQEERLLVMVKDLRSQLKNYSDKNDDLLAENDSLRLQIKIQNNKDINENLSQELSKEIQNKKQEKYLKNELDLLDVKKNQLNSNNSSPEKTEVRYLDVKQNSESQSNIEPEMLTELCRKFASEKSEIVAQHETEISSIKEKLETLKNQVTAKNNELKCLNDLLEIEKLQYSESLESLQETITKLKKSSVKIESENSHLEKELVKKFEAQILLLKQEHAKDLNSIKSEIQKKHDTLLAEKQKCLDMSSVNCNIEILQQQIMEEHKIMNERLLEIRESFECEALDIHNFLNGQKNKLKKELEKEMEIFEKRFAEETQGEIKLKNSILVEKEKYLDLLLKTEEQENKLQLLTTLNEEENRKTDQCSFANDISIIHKTEEEGTSFNNQSLKAYESEIEDKNQKIEQQFLKNEIQNVNLTEKINELKEIIQINKHEIASLQTISKVKVAENKQLELENQILNQKVRDHNHNQLGLKQRPANENFISSKHFQNAIDQKNTEISDLKIGISTLKKELKECKDVPPPTNKLNPKNIFSEENKSNFTNSHEQGPLRQRLSHVTSRLSEQMKKTKDMYTKLSKTEMLVKDMYCENTQLMRALQLTEIRQKEAEKLCQDEKDRTDSLTNLLQSVFVQLSQ